MTYLLARAKRDSSLDRAIPCNFKSCNEAFAVDIDNYLWVEDRTTTPLSERYNEVGLEKFVKTDILVQEIKESCGNHLILDRKGCIRALHWGKKISDVLVRDVIAFTTFLYDANWNLGYPTGLVYVTPKGMIYDRYANNRGSKIDIAHHERIQEFEIEDQECYERTWCTIIYILDVQGRLFFRGRMLAQSVIKVLLLHDRLWYLTKEKEIYCYCPREARAYLIAPDVTEMVIFAERICYLTGTGVVKNYSLQPMVETCESIDNCQGHHQHLFDHVTDMHVNHRKLYVLVQGRLLYRAEEYVNDVRFELVFTSPYPCHKISKAHVNGNVYLLHCRK